MDKFIAVTGGGTGGHLSIGKVFIDYLHSIGYQVIYIGSTAGADKKWFESYDNITRAYFLETTTVVDRNIFGKMKALLNIFRQTIKAVQILKIHNISKVISVGGFSASAGSFGAIIARKQLFLHEQNSVMGRLNKVCKPFATEVFGSYDNATYKVDYPVDERYFKLQRVRTQIRHIIFLGGSQGSVAINDFAVRLAPSLHKKGITISHQTGEKHISKVRQQYEKLGLKVDSFGFTDKLFDKLRKSDIAVCRAGAGTVWELCAMGLPAVFVPYPYAASDHQRYNAKFLKELSLCDIVDEKELKPQIVIEFIENFKQDQSLRMIQQISQHGIKNMTKRILDDDD